MAEQVLRPADQLAATNTIRRPGESADYREARQALLREEIELRRHHERVTQMRRALPAGAPVTKAYSFAGENGETTLESLFGPHQTLVVYSYMFGPQRSNPCPMCTSFMGSFENKIADINQRVAIAFTARSPLTRLLEAKAARGWKNIPVYSDSSGDYTRDYVSAEDADMPAYNVFSRRDGTVRHFWSEEIGPDMADPGQDPRGGLEMDPLWLVLDSTPEGRGSDWYPKLAY